MDYSILILLGFLLVTVNHVNAAPSVNVRIAVGKAVTDRSKFAYQAGILYKKTTKLFCGGSIIHKRFILTAAHCCFRPARVQKPASTLLIEVGHIKWKTGILKDVQSVIVHKDYDHEMQYNDIALMAIFGTFEPWTEKVNLISLKTSPTLDGNCILSGFGATDPDNDASPVLLYEDVTVVDQITCKKAFDELPDNTICTRSDASACFGDSGGPLVCSNQLAGVVSVGDLICATDVLPNIFMEVAKYKDWIDFHIKSTAFGAKTIDSTTSPPSSAERRNLSLFFLLITIVPLLRFIPIKLL